MGRPPEYSHADKERVIDHICDELVNKRFVSSILREDEGMPPPSRFAQWLAESEVFREKVARAREAGVEAHLEDMIAIADDASDDVEVRYDSKGKPYAYVNGVTTQRAKVMIYAREKAAQMLAPRRFGQKLDVTSDGKALPAPQANTLVIADNRVQSLIALAAHNKAEAEAAATKLLED